MSHTPNGHSEPASADHGHDGHARATPDSFEVRILRQDAPGQPSYWERHKVKYEPDMNVISVLQRIAARATASDGKKVAPVAWDCNCLEEVCGACTMLINGKVRQSCSALVDKLGPPGEPITLEPMSKFPVIRDLFVDRQRLFDDLKRVKAWVPIDTTYDLGPGPPVPQRLQEERYPLSRCISCGCRLDACPQYTPGNKLVGAAVGSQARLFNDHPIGAAVQDERIGGPMHEAGVG